MAVIPFIDLVPLLSDAGFAGGTSQATGIAIIAAESGRDPAATHVNTDGSVDRGLWQINSKAHPEVTDAQAFDPVQATVAAFTISDKGTNYSPWSTYTNLAYRTHTEAAKVALDGYSRLKSQQAENAALHTAINSAVSTLQSV